MEFHSENINELVAALSKAQAKIKSAVKDSANPYFKSKYADLAGIWDACQVPLTENGLAFSSMFFVNEMGQPCIMSMLMHGSGQWIRSVLPLNPVKNDPQGVGSAITYYRRYTLAAMVGVTTDDDDGEGAMNRSFGPAKNEKRSEPEPVEHTGEPQPDTHVSAQKPAKVNWGIVMTEATKAGPSFLAAAKKQQADKVSPEEAWDNVFGKN